MALSHLSTPLIQDCYQSQSTLKDQLALETGCLEEQGAHFHILHQVMCWGTGYCPGICREQSLCAEWHIHLLNCEKVHNPSFVLSLSSSHSCKARWPFIKGALRSFQMYLSCASLWAQLGLRWPLGGKLQRVEKAICNVWKLGWTRKTTMMNRDQCKTKEQEQEDSEYEL